MIIDARGMACPQPLIETKKVIDTLTQQTDVEVILDNDIAVCNVEEYLKQLGIEARREGSSVLFRTAGVSTSTVAMACAVPSGGGEYAVVINSMTMGRGDEQLGTILLKAFISTLSQSDKQPSHLIFYNEGVKCATKDSGVIDALRRMEEQGVAIIVCGTCVEFFGLKESIAVGVISNMFKIVEVLQSVSKVVYP